MDSAPLITEANLTLAQLCQGGEKDAAAHGLAANLSKVFGQNFRPENVARQIDLLRLDPRKMNHPDPPIAWQPDALKMLADPANASLPASQLAKKIYDETGQVVTRHSVLGKQTRIREERMRAELAEAKEK